MIKIPISVGELIDKLSILNVKQNMISDKIKLDFVNKEFELLYNFSSTYLDNEEILKNLSRVSCSEYKIMEN